MKSCGNCLWARNPEGQFIECWGAPPNPYVMAMGQDQLGRAQMRVELIRPRLAKTTPYCGKWEAKTADGTKAPLDIDLSAFAKDAGTS